LYIEFKAYYYNGDDSQGATYDIIAPYHALSFQKMTKKAGHIYYGIFVKDHCCRAERTAVGKYNVTEKEFNRIKRLYIKWSEDRDNRLEERREPCEPCESNMDGLEV